MIDISEKGFNFGAFVIENMPSYIDPLTNETITPLFDDVLTFKADVLLYDGAFGSETISKPKIRHCNTEDLEKLVAHTTGEKNVIMKSHISNYLCFDDPSKIQLLGDIDNAKDV